MPDTLTFLAYTPIDRDTGLPGPAEFTGKTFSGPERTKTSFNKKAFGPWRVHRAEFTSLDHFAEILPTIEPIWAHVRGTTVAPDMPSIPWRTKLDHPQQPKTLIEELHHLIPIDVDDPNWVGGVLDFEAQARDIRSRLPSPFNAQQMLFVPTSQCGLEPGIRARAWVWSADPMNDAECKALFGSFDSLVYSAEHLTYIAAPRFLAGAVDPIGPERRRVYRLAALEAHEVSRSVLGHVLAPADLAAMQANMKGLSEHGLTFRDLLNQIPELSPGERHPFLKRNTARIARELWEKVGVPTDQLLDKVKYLISSELARRPQPMGDWERTVEWAVESVIATPTAAKFRFTDTAMAHKFVLDSKHRLFWVPELKCWYVWCGTHWKPLIGPDAAMPELTAWLDDLEAQFSKDPDLGKLVRSYQSTGRQTALLKAARHDAEYRKLSADDLDAYSNLLNFANGTLDINTLVLHPHSPEHLLTCVIDYAYDSKRTCPVFEREVALYSTDQDGNSDPSWVEYIRWVAAQCLHGKACEIVPFFTGGGGNGKSTLRIILGMLIGPYAGSLPADAFTANRHDSRFGRLRSKRGVFCSDISTSSPLDATQVKVMASHEPMTAQPDMGVKAIDFYVTWLFIAICNGIPRFVNADGGIARRSRTIPFDVRLADHFDTLDDNRPELFRAELPGILNWALRGLRYGTKEPECARVKALTKECFEEVNNPLSHWTNDPRFGTLDKNASELSANLAESYQRACVAHNVKPLPTEQALWRALDNQDIRKVPGKAGHSREGNLRKGFRLTVQPDLPAKAGPIQAAMPPFFEPQKPGQA